MIFHGDTFLLAIYDQEIGNNEFLNRTACSPYVGQYQSAQNLYSEVTSYELYDVFDTHFSMIFDKKTCTVDQGQF